MAPILTLHQGDEAASYVEHPIEVARRALMAAAEIEEPRLAHQLDRFAQALPHRAPITKGGD